MVLQVHCVNFGIEFPCVSLARYTTSQSFHMFWFLHINVDLSMIFMFERVLQTLVSFTLYTFSALIFTLLNIVLLLLQMDGQVIALLVQNLDRLDENVKEDSDGVHNSLGLWTMKQALWTIQLFVELFASLQNLFWIKCNLVGLLLLYNYFHVEFIFYPEQKKTVTQKLPHWWHNSAEICMEPLDW